MIDSDPTDVTQTPPPPRVVTQEDQARWELAGLIARTLWTDFEPDAPLDNAWYWTMQRSIYSSDIPTGRPD